MKKQHVFDEKNKNDADIITDLNSTMNTSWNMKSKNSLPRVREIIHKNNDVIPRNILFSKVLKPLINADALKAKINPGLISVCDWTFCFDLFCMYQMCSICMYACIHTYMYACIMINDINVILFVVTGRHIMSSRMDTKKSKLWDIMTDAEEIAHVCTGR